MSWYIDDADNLVTHDHDPQAERYYGIDATNTMAEGDGLATAKAYLAGTATELAPVITPGGDRMAYKVTPLTPTLTVGRKLGITFEWTTTLGEKDQRTVWLNVVER